jgi:hypothetical protein
MNMKKQDVEVLNGFKWPRIGSKVGLLWTQKWSSERYIHICMYVCIYMYSRTRL